MKKQEILRANISSRSMGAIGAKAIAPRYVEKIATKENSILDYGAGKDAIHTLRLREKGYNVVAYEFGDNIIEGLHSRSALINRYDIVFASNVLNVQSGIAMLITTLYQISNVLKDGGIAVFNYPRSPRYLDISSIELIKIITEVFGRAPCMVGGTRSAPLLSVQI